MRYDARVARAIAIETSGRIGSIAIVRDGQVLFEEQFPHGLQHAAQIVPIIDRLSRAAGWQPRDVEELYLSIGPGSFTGLRIAVTLAKTMALATGTPIVAVPSADVLAHNAPADAQHVIIVLDAKRGQIYTARYRRANQGNPAGESCWRAEEPAHLDTLPAMLERSPRPVHLLGEGIAYHRHEIRDDPQIIITPEERWRARASVVARLGGELARSGAFADPLTLAPVYIRLPEAEEKWRATQGSDTAAAETVRQGDAQI